MGSYHEPEALKVIRDRQVQSLKWEATFHVEGYPSAFATRPWFVEYCVAVNVGTLLRDGAGHPCLCDGCDVNVVDPQNTLEFVDFALVLDSSTFGRS